MPVLWLSRPLRPCLVIRCSHIVDTATLLLILPFFQPQSQSHYKAASNPRLFITVGRVPITQLGEAMATKTGQDLGVSISTLAGSQTTRFE